MVMVEIDSNAILVEPLTSRKDPELTRAYRKMMLRLKLAGIVPKKHVLDNEVLEAMTDVICNIIKWRWNLSHRAATGAMLPRRPFETLKPISSAY